MEDVINRNGRSISFEAAKIFMDEEIRENLHWEIAPCTEQEFFTAYENPILKNLVKNGSFQKQILSGKKAKREPLI